MNARSGLFSKQEPSRYPKCHRKGIVDFSSFLSFCSLGARGAAIRPEEIGALKRLELIFPFVTLILVAYPAPLRWFFRENTRWMVRRSQELC
jgi:hypothetical protein